ncbi:MAG: phosphodiester glycosidase family protein [Cyclobacteriaceae bacterium]
MNKIRHIIIAICWLGSFGCQAQSTEKKPADTIKLATIANQVTIPADSVAKDSVSVSALQEQIREQQFFLDSITSELSKKNRWYRNVRSELNYYKRNISNLVKHNKSFGWRIEFLGKTYDAYIVDIDAVNVKIFHRDNRGKNHSFKTIASQAKSNGTDLAFAMNAGMFTRDHNPQGLYIENGKEKFPVDPRKSGYGNFYMQFRKNDPEFGLSNGVFLISKEKGAHIIYPDSLANYNKKQVTLATQSGPLMVMGGKFNEHFNRGSKNLNIRNGVGIINDRKVVFVISNEPVNFYEFSQLFRDFFHCDEALYLDGVISQIYAPELGTIQHSGSGFGPILGVIR